MKRTPETEAAIVARVVSWLRADGWRTWQEVQVVAGRADIVAQRTGLLWCVEAKKTASLALVEQGMERQRAGAFHGVLLAIPRAQTGFAHLCSRLGLGLITAGYRMDYGGSVDPRLEVWPDFERRPRSAQVLAACTDDAEIQAGGLPGSMRCWTPFKAAIRGLIEHFEGGKIERMTVREVAGIAPVAAYKLRAGHPAPTKAEVQVMRRWVVQTIQNGWAPGFKLDGEGVTRAVVFDGAAITAEERAVYRVKTGPRRTACEVALQLTGSPVEAAALLGITRHSLKRRIIKHNIKWVPEVQAPTAG